MSGKPIPKRQPNDLRASTIFRSAVIPQNNEKEVVGLMSDAMPPEADSRSEVAALLHEQFARLTRRLRTLELPHGMTAERLSALSVIEKRGPISVTALADTEMVRPATVSSSRWSPRRASGSDTPCRPADARELAPRVLVKARRGGVR